ncbi:DUF6582 domain-containing protein [Sulfobacillus thermosulfidooxidans]|uniref:DUF6582 domain-containing protein n=1 Tax=Sulfobacillus thermosulfidooxidans TaxID=28034 RepID=UPI000411DDEA|nr:DUF6582 domain-containing protein [Sulfobacillus thermosulfidooxidans]
MLKSLKPITIEDFARDGVVDDKTKKGVVIMNEEHRHAKGKWETFDPEEIPPIEDDLPPGAHRTPPKGYPLDRNQYAIPAWYALPIDTPEHARNAASRFPQMDVYDQLGPAAKERIWRRIVDAERVFGIEPSREVLERAGYSE